MERPATGFKPTTRTVLENRSLGKENSQDLVSPQRVSPSPQTPLKTTGATVQLHRTGSDCLSGPQEAPPRVFLGRGTSRDTGRRGGDGRDVNEVGQWRDPSDYHDLWFRIKLGQRKGTPYLGPAGPKEDSVRTDPAGHLWFKGRQEQIGWRQTTRNRKLGTLGPDKEFLWE